MVALITISFILSAFPLFTGCISLPILGVQKFLLEQGEGQAEQRDQQEKSKAWFYGLWLPTIIWTIAFIAYKTWAHMFLYNASLIEPLDYFGGIFFVIFYFLFYWGYSSRIKNESLEKSYDASYVFKIVFPILLFFIFALLCSVFYCLIKLRF